MLFSLLLLIKLLLRLCAAALGCDFMPCYHPVTAYRSLSGRDPITGKWPIVFSVNKGYADMPVVIPCGQCIGCRLERSRQWAVRCVHEASLYTIESGGRGNCFLTLTYDDNHLPKSPYVDLDSGEIIVRDFLPTLNKRDIMLFMKRLRKEFGDGIRFFQCGEYGDIKKRPHHHVLLFNFDFADKKYFCTKNGSRLYTSASLERLWPYGQSLVGAVTFESAAYVARYICKKITGSSSDEHYNTRQPEFITMSRRPGIAREWFNKFHSDIYPADSCMVRPGLSAKPPKYYDNLYELQDSASFCRIKALRKKMASKSVDNTPERLAVRKAVKLHKYSLLLRPLE